MFCVPTWTGWLQCFYLELAWFLLQPRDLQVRWSDNAKLPAVVNMVVSLCVLALWLPGNLSRVLPLLLPSARWVECLILISYCYQSKSQIVSASEKCLPSHTFVSYWFISWPFISKIPVRCIVRSLQSKKKLLYLCAKLKYIWNAKLKLINDTCTLYPDTHQQSVFPFLSFWHLLL